VKDVNAQEALHKEIQTLSQMDHPNIMALFEVIDTRMNVNLVMEMCNGKSLYHYIKKKENMRLPEELCRIIFRQLVDGIAYLHSNDIVHRDLKLDNILIDPSDGNRIKIIDFGFSIRASADQKLTLFCGTPHYMDPDISRKKDYNGHAADVWALGVILFILLTGKLPFFGEFEQDLYRKI
jgi:MAP/microtubule affinity-regulating kinase